MGLHRVLRTKKWNELNVKSVNTCDYLNTLKEIQSGVIPQQMWLMYFLKIYGRKNKQTVDTIR